MTTMTRGREEGMRERERRRVGSFESEGHRRF
jgi:hypothetical protein